MNGASVMLKWLADGSGIVINIDVLDINKGCTASHILTQKGLVAGKLHVPFLVRLFYLVTAVGFQLLIVIIYTVNQLSLHSVHCTYITPFVDNESESLLA